MNEARILNTVQRDRPKAERRMARYLKQERANAYLDGVLSMVGPGQVCIDCGANVGKISRRFADTGAQVHAFEPEPIAFEKLTENVGALPNMTLHQAAVGTKPDELELFRVDGFEEDPVGHTVSSTLLQKAGDNYRASGIKVQVIDFVAFLKEVLTEYDRIAVLKMDIEGYEIEVVDALIQADLLARISNTLVETHARKRRGSGTKLAQFRQLSEANPAWHLNLDWV